MRKPYIQTARESVAMYNIMGIKGHTDLQDIIAVIVGSGAKPEICGRLASYGLSSLSDMTIEEYQSEGLTYLQSVQLQGAFVLANLCSQVEKKEERYVIRSPEDAARYMIPEFKDLQQEHFVVMTLNVKNEVTGVEVVFKGSLNASIVHPRETFRLALKKSAGSIIVFHNHPSENVQPSQEDIDVTKRLVEAGNLMGIDVLDHIIIGGDNHLSMKEKGFM